MSYFKSTDVKVLNVVQDRQPSWVKMIRARGKVLKYFGFNRLYLDSDYGQRTDRENDVETEHEMERPPVAPSRASRQNQQH